MNKKDLKIALAHDFLVEFGGAERVLKVLCEMFPDAPIYSLLYDKEKAPEWLKNKKIHTSFLQKFPKFLRQRKKWLLPFFPVAPETFDLRDFDLVISSSGAWSKGIITRLNTIHIAYLHSPIRFAWDMNGEYLDQQKKCGITNFFARAVLNYIRVWDKAAADRPEYIISNSKYTQARIKKYYGRESEVIYPPVEILSSGRDEAMPRLYSGDKYFLVISRLSPYKKVDVVIEAFNKLKLPLVIVGSGGQEKYLKSIAGETIKFLGFQPDEKLPEIYANARAFIFPCVDDFGVAPAEAMSFGVPVLAVRKGGAREIVLEGKTGEFFENATPENIIGSVNKFIEKEKQYDKEFIKFRAGEFSKERFKKELGEYIDNIINF
ncbi:MAG TPA: glycosyltransferase family 4 protein [Candidatus Moranbacteria bacterium]|nr:glycosyltransferase family 4 protein [Candidatus Moranbacteria bacterium]